MIHEDTATGDLFVRAGAPRTATEALEAAKQANNPAKVVENLYLAVAYQQQQIDLLEIAVASKTERLGEFGKIALEGVGARARKLVDQAAARVGR